MISDIMKKYGLIESLYPVIRVVDPINKTVIDSYTKKGFEHGSETHAHKCYNFWAKGNVCANCIAMRALNEKDSFVKLEFAKNSIFLVTALPITYNNQSYVLEFLKDVTNSGLVDTINFKGQAKLMKMLEAKNELLIQDPLTKSYNRRFIEERLPYEYILSSGDEKPFAIAMADIDFFKKVNDNYGHQAGDYILINFVKKISETIRSKTDWIARYGGEEFIIFFKNIELDEINMVMEKIRASIESNTFLYEDTPIKITSSFGVSFSNESSNFKNLIELADKRLYKAKETGRNKVIID